MNRQVLILDNEQIRHIHLAQKYRDWTRFHAWSTEEAIWALNHYHFDLASLDYDLGEVDEGPPFREVKGIVVARYICGMMPDTRPVRVTVHSTNPFGGQEMRDLFREYGIPLDL